MEIIHICTTESFRAGLEEIPPSKCFMCGNKTMFIDYVGAKCDTCGADTAWDNDLAGLVRSIRECAGLSRKDVSKIIGIKPSTIKYYEWHHPSRRYFNAFKSLIKNKYIK